MFTYDSGAPKSMGPHGLGDPEDFSLRKVELEILIPKIMRDRAKTEKCIPEVKAFEECCKTNGVKMIFSCRSQNDCLKSCLAKWYQDEEFKTECKGVYLQQRSEYRRTGIKKGEEKK